MQIPVPFLTFYTKRLETPHSNDLPLLSSLFPSLFPPLTLENLNFIAKWGRGLPAGAAAPVAVPGRSHEELAQKSRIFSPPVRAKCGGGGGGHRGQGERGFAASCLF